ncbi:hypothetical protein ATO11_09640 [Pseudaestuariivita atlantica]|uniref:Lysine transporter LysE n=1 Tax=Pseudaestuariivita atlantica TaxID=1317121 RepID=A0A0L1JQ75_9RHOB|nr:hypothetical protein ATO11_09640 [Pseudaestuariivita atlantica]
MGEVYTLYLLTLVAFFVGPPDATEFLVMSNTVRHGKRGTRLTILGDLSANAVQMTIAAFGLAALVAQAGWVLGAVKWAGVAYLAYLGLTTLLSKPGRVQAEVVPGRRLVWQGFVNSMVNPWPIMFFAALFPQFITAGDPILPQLLLLGVTYLMFDFVQLVFWAWSARKLSERMDLLNGPWLTRVSGTLMLLAAGFLALKDIEIERG